MFIKMSIDRDEKESGRRGGKGQCKDDGVRESEREAVKRRREKRRDPTRESREREERKNHLPLSLPILRRIVSPRQPLLHEMLGTVTPEVDAVSCLLASLALSCRVRSTSRRLIACGCEVDDCRSDCVVSQNEREGRLALFGLLILASLSLSLVIVSFSFSLSSMRVCVTLSPSLYHPRRRRPHSLSLSALVVPRSLT